MSITYKDSGVDKEAGYKEVQLIKGFIKKTHIPGVLSELGGFAGLFEPDLTGIENPVLVSGTDGVGTKLKLAFMMNKHNTIGRDCVAMCVNDILCQGAKPLFFLDYIATGKLVPEKMAEIVEGIAEGCVEAGCALIGGETAEMPGFYKDGEYDVAGFAVGIADKIKLLTCQAIREGDKLVAVASSGVHSNGFSLIRKIVFEKMGYNVDTYIEGLNKTIGEELITPTKIYTKEIFPLISECNIKGISHITGGGFYENLPRVLNDEQAFLISKDKIKVKEIFKLLMQWGNISEEEMFGTFNMGVGLACVMGAENVDRFIQKAEDCGLEAYEIGEVIKKQGSSVVWKG